MASGHHRQHSISDHDHRSTGGSAAGSPGHGRKGVTPEEAQLYPTLLHLSDLITDLQLELQRQED
jgi:hypothetical protein